VVLFKRPPQYPQHDPRFFCLFLNGPILGNSQPPDSNAKSETKEPNLARHSQKIPSHPIRLDVGGSDSRTRKRKKIGMRLSSVAGRLQPMRARRPSSFSRCTSGDCGIIAGARKPRQNSRPAARTRAVTRAHLESEPNDRTRVCQAPRVDIS